jgi:hypothetical protein
MRRGWNCVAWKPVLTLLALAGQVFWLGAQHHAVVHGIEESSRAQGAQHSRGLVAIAGAEADSDDHDKCPLCQLGTRTSALVLGVASFLQQCEAVRQQPHWQWQEPLVVIYVLPPGRGPPAVGA